MINEALIQETHLVGQMEYKRSSKNASYYASLMASYDSLLAQMNEETAAEYEQRFMS